MHLSLIRTAVLTFTIVASGCSKDASSPDAKTSVEGHWVASDTVGVFTGFDIRMTQAENGTISGRWVGKTRITNGKCDAEFGCAPSNIVFGSHLNLRVDIQILGAGGFTGQMASRDAIVGDINRFGVLYRLRMRKVP